MPFRPDDVELSVIKGQTEPYYLGWLPEGVQGKRPSPVAVYQWKAIGPTTRAWALVPTQKDILWAVESLEVLKADDAGNLTATLRGPDADVQFERRAGMAADGIGTINCSVKRGGQPEAQITVGE